MTEIANLYDSRTYERGIPHDTFAWLREHEPVHWQSPVAIKANVPGIMRTEQRGYWAVTRHRDIIDISLDQKCFSSERGTVITSDISEDRMAQLRLWMINRDAPGHTKLRKLVNKGFTRRMIDKMEGHVRELCREIVDGVALKGECDFVTSIASELPLLVIAELLGCPAEDRTRLFEWSNQMIGFEDPEFANEAGATDAMTQMFEYSSALAAKRRSDPRDDLTSVLVPPSTCSSSCWCWPETRLPATRSPAACWHSASTGISGRSSWTIPRFCPSPPRRSSAT
jgi:cholest-4-en-3-one 26-monooxygenase